MATPFRSTFSRLVRCGHTLPIRRLGRAVRTLRRRNGARARRGQTLRIRGGRREVDLIVERADQRVVAFEVKLSRTVVDDDVRNLLWLREQIGDELLDAAVITTGPEAYRRSDGVAVIPAALLGA